MPNTCRQCQTQFEIASEDLQFYDRVSPVLAGKKYKIPPPALCPTCRVQRRMSFRNFRNLYHRKCDLTGKQILSMYGPDIPQNYSRPFKVYDLDAWWGDAWDPLEYGRDIDF